jgi:hypothetical protein
MMSTSNVQFVRITASMVEEMIKLMNEKKLRPAIFDENTNTIKKL